MTTGKPHHVALGACFVIVFMWLSHLSLLLKYTTETRVGILCATLSQSHQQYDRFPAQGQSIVEFKYSCTSWTVFNLTQIFHSIHMAI